MGNDGPSAAHMNWARWGDQWLSGVKMWKRDMLRTKKTNVIVFEQDIQLSTFNFFEDILPQLVWESICLTCLRIDSSLTLNLKIENNRIPWISGYQDFIAKGGDKNTLLMKPLSPINVSQYLKWKKTHIKTWCFFSAFFCLARFVNERGGDPL